MASAEEYDHEDDVDSQDPTGRTRQTLITRKMRAIRTGRGTPAKTGLEDQMTEGLAVGIAAGYSWVDGGIEGDYSGDDDVYDEFHGGIERHSGYREVAYDPFFDDVGGES